MHRFPSVRPAAGERPCTCLTYRRCPIMLQTTQPAFATSEGLRVLLVRLHDAGPGAWRTDPEAAALMP